MRDLRDEFGAISKTDGRKTEIKIKTNWSCNETIKTRENLKRDCAKMFRVLFTLIEDNQILNLFRAFKYSLCLRTQKKQFYSLNFKLHERWEMFTKANIISILICTIWIKFISRVSEREALSKLFREFLMKFMCRLKLFSIFKLVFWIRLQSCSLKNAPVTMHQVTSKTWLK